MSHETQKTITNWADETFGPVNNNFRVAARANEEMAELLRALSVGDEEKAREEAADVVIVLARLATRLERKLFPPTWPEHNSKRPTNYATLANNDMSWLLMRLEMDQNSIDAHGDIWNIVSLMHAICIRLGTDLQTEIDKKMAVNRARTWKLDGSGHGYHVR